MLVCQGEAGLPERRGHLLGGEMSWNGFPQGPPVRSEQGEIRSQGLIVYIRQEDHV